MGNCDFGSGVTTNDKDVTFNQEQRQKTTESPRNNRQEPAQNLHISIEQKDDAPAYKEITFNNEDAQQEQQRENVVDLVNSQEKVEQDTGEEEPERQNVNESSFIECNDHTDVKIVEKKRGKETVKVEVPKNVKLVKKGLAKAIEEKISSSD